jgi:alpha-beta hydrolase superfamily lysophospholipase
MKHSEGTLQVSPGGEIYYQCWTPGAAPRGLIIVVHGMAEHGGRYDRFAAAATERGYAVAALDQPGHGRSYGEKAYVDRFEDFQRALAVFHEAMAAEFAGIPHFLLGHSLGGLIGGIYLLRAQERFAGCVMSGPAVKTQVEPPALQMLLIRLLSALLPRLGVLQLEAEGVSRNPEEVARYLADPLVYSGKIAARVVAELFAAMTRLRENCGQITLPLLLLHGGEDRMTDPEGSRLLHERVGSADKTLRVYPGLYHEVFNEPERDAVFGEVFDWLDARCG